MFSEEKAAAAEALKRYEYVSLSPQKVDQLARDIEARKVHGTWLMEPGQDPSDCFLLIPLAPPAFVSKLKRLQVVHCYEYMGKAIGANKKGQPTFMTVSFLDKRDMVRVDKRLKEIRNRIGR